MSETPEDNESILDDELRAAIEFAQEAERIAIVFRNFIDNNREAQAMMTESPEDNENRDRVSGSMQEILQRARAGGLDHEPLVEPIGELIGRAGSLGDVVRGEAWSGGRELPGNDGGEQPRKNVVDDLARRVGKAVADEIRKGTG